LGFSLTCLIAASDRHLAGIFFGQKQDKSYTHRCIAGTVKKFACGR